MNRAAAIDPVRGHPRLFRSTEDGRPTYWTPGLGDPPEVYGERVVHREAGALRRWDPTRSKLGAALARGYDGPTPGPDEFWLYLGAATGTTASHVADLVGPRGAVFAVEKSLRSFSRLLRLADRYPNLLPLLADARECREYLPLVPPVDGLYADLAQPDQVAIVIENSQWFVKPGGLILLALKTASMGRLRTPRAHLDSALTELDPLGRVEESIALEPFHKRHYLVSVRTKDGALPAVARGPRPRSDRPAGSSR
ncbi:MAG TPA: fibrillarin-like rRNA/tRNA 2'-O-methyltransferase [Thermoplasmata archaeon]|nr:fibrillarin-like rRNA/tRNA 2'-O-methyltransferase [Thermoplasmata archaeon]